MESAEQLWRAGECEHYIPVSPTESDTEPDNEPTLVPSHDISFEDTLTEDNVETKMDDIQEDEPTDEDSRAAEAIYGNKDRNDKVRDGTDMVSTYDSATDGSITSREGFDTARERGAEVLAGNEDVDGNEVIEDAEQSFISYASIPQTEATEGDEVFEDCVGDEEVEKFDRVTENYSLEMKLALGIDNAK